MPNSFFTYQKNVIVEVFEFEDIVNVICGSEKFHASVAEWRSQ